MKDSIEEGNKFIEEGSCIVINACVSESRDNIPIWERDENYVQTLAPCCWICAEFFKNDDELKSHNEKFHETSSSYVCKFCSSEDIKIRFTNEALLKEHLKQCHLEAYVKVDKENIAVFKEYNDFMETMGMDMNIRGKMNIFEIAAIPEMTLRLDSYT